MKGILLFFILSALHMPVFPQVIITEIMADPTPAVDLPEFEYVEIRNRSNLPVRLIGWMLADVRTAGELPDAILHPDSILILASESGKPVLASLGRVVVVSPWPSLNNSGDVLQLIAADGGVRDSVAYLPAWYGSENKAQGGWSLERIDLLRQCSGKDNWTASMHPSGGTPGRENSVNAGKPDLTGPVIRQALWWHEEGLRVELSEPVLTSGTGPHNFKILQGPVPESLRFADSADTLWLGFAEKPDPSVARILRADNLSDCAGNLAGSEISILWPSPPVAEALRINEVLFNPGPGVVDFVELVNRTGALLLGKELVLTYRKEAGETVEKILSGKREMLFEAGQFVLLSQDPAVVLSEYAVPMTTPSRSWPLFNIPDQGGVLVLRVNGILQDSVLIRESFHHVMLRDREGVSLERTDPEQKGTVAAAWLSSAAGATPGMENSQQTGLGRSKEIIFIHPEIVTPLELTNNVMLIELNLPVPGITGSLKIFDLHGMLQATVTENEVLGTRQIIRWDVTADSGNILGPGYYILVADFFGPDGFREKSMHRIIVGW